MKIKLPASAQNWISLVGATIALISLFMIIFLFTVTLFREQGGTYLGLVTYILLPVFLVIGLLLIPVGMIIKVRRERKAHHKMEAGWPRIDLNNAQHRHAFFIFTIGTTIFLFLSAIGSYEAFHYTESTQFCGTLCHSVMNPEYTAYQNSPHAQVACVSCHVGPGAGWYVRSKLSGLYQVYAVATNVYPRPIPTPIDNLRPAREVCEQCHWPQKFYARKLRFETHYLADEGNSRWDYELIMKIGAKHPSQGLKEGIHWHINPKVRVEYIATDEGRQDIAWVKYVNLETGEEKVFQDENNPLDKAQMDTLETRTMDCIDCHNRPSHRYRPPTLFLNSAMTAGKVPPGLPDIKSVALELCDQEYSTMDSAKLAIENKIHTYYQKNYPEIARDSSQKIAQAIAGVQEAFSTNIFPEMKVRWSAYPDNIGHLEYKGCFRCHNNTHADEQGNYIRNDCNLCHYITAQGSPDSMQVAEFGQALEFKHPVDIYGAWQEMACSECHTGLNP